MTLEQQAFENGLPFLFWDLHCIITKGEGNLYYSGRESAIKSMPLYRNDSRERAEASSSFRVAYAAEIFQLWSKFLSTRANFT